MICTHFFLRVGSNSDGNAAGEVVGVGPLGANAMGGTLNGASMQRKVSKNLEIDLPVKNAARKKREGYPSLFQDRHRPGDAYPVLFFWRMLNTKSFAFTVNYFV
jgi:hypothetical protein